MFYIQAVYVLTGKKRVLSWITAKSKKRLIEKVRYYQRNYYIEKYGNMCRASKDHLTDDGSVNNERFY